MKTFCVVKDNGTHDLVQGVSVFEVEDSFHAMQLEIQKARYLYRPHSTIPHQVRSGGGSFMHCRRTYFENQLPVTVGGIVLRRKVAKEV